MPQRSSNSALSATQRCGAAAWNTVIHHHSAPQGAIQLLLRFGAVHTCPVPPAIPPAVLATMPAAEVAAARARRQAALKVAGNGVSCRTGGDTNLPTGCCSHCVCCLVHLCCSCRSCWSSCSCSVLQPVPSSPSPSCSAAHLPQTEARTPQRVTEDLVIPENSYVRVHLMPKRFPAAYSVSWAVSPTL